MSYQTTITEDRRLSILLVLQHTPGYTANAYLLREAIDQIYGHAASLDQIRTDLAWLAEQQLVRTQEAASTTLATLAERGHDVALGRATQPGVKKPSPAP